ncbi:hypothetical protein O159_20990 [Leifsonia xyli subsp. cynodontis DSM 46306]|uniref:Large exoprotein n=1 Tax=Leifsonia xyli subsp. cynodontis DSM 46306 TaxID=1389489 RepID=U3P8E2_LEIXC|nr:hypothetical protein [Leifsonia xyli]AGW42081.1 hypothetical protein O159_20990 [Leifsonia xyli subsp. cynodontis DSM 46306]
MNGDVMGGGVVVALAAALWLAYLVPVWLRRREYLATERNAVRLQQTLRILAETAELPDEVRLEATAKTVAEQQRILRRAEDKRAATARAEAAAIARREQALADERRRAAEDAERAAAAAIAVERASRAAAAQRANALAAATSRPALSPQRRRRLRRSRALTTLVLVAGVVGAIGGVPALLATGAWILPVLSLAIVIAALWTLGRLARPAAAASPASPRIPVAPTTPALYDDAQHDLPVQERLRQSWTPRPLPKPLHLSPGTVAAAAMASVDAATELRRTAARVEFDRRCAEVAPPPPAPVPLRPRPAEAAPAAATLPAPAEPSRYATMGIVDADVHGALDLDAVLRRRRAAS